LLDVDADIVQAQVRAATEAQLQLHWAVWVVELVLGHEELILLATKTLWFNWVVLEVISAVHVDVNLAITLVLVPAREIREDELELAVALSVLCSTGHIESPVATAVSDAWVVKSPVERTASLLNLVESALKSPLLVAAVEKHLTNLLVLRIRFINSCTSHQLLDFILVFAFLSDQCLDIIEHLLGLTVFFLDVFVAHVVSIVQFGSSASLLQRLKVSLLAFEGSSQKILLTILLEENVLELSLVHLLSGLL